MEGQSQLYTVASVIGVIVVFAMAACFAILFAVYANQRIKNIRGGLDDENLSKDLDRMMNRYLDRSFNSYRRKATSVRDKSEEPEFPQPNVKKEDGLYVSSLKDAQRGSTALVRFGNFLYVLFIVLCLGLAGFGIYMNSSDQPIFINNTSYIVIMTGSMEERNPDNEYLLENDLDDQITQYSLIGIEHTDFDQRQRQGKHPVSRRVHLDIVPLHAEQGAPFFVEFDEFAPADGGPPNGRAQNRTSGPAFESAEDESDRIARIKNSPLRADALLHDPDS